MLQRLYVHDSNVPLQNLRVKAAFPSEFFKVKFSSRNGTYHIVETLLKGITHIDATLASVQKEVGMLGRQTIACPRNIGLFEQFDELNCVTRSGLRSSFVCIVVQMCVIFQFWHTCTCIVGPWFAVVLSPHLLKKLVVPIGLFEQFDGFISVTLSFF